MFWHASLHIFFCKERNLSSKHNIYTAQATLVCEKKRHVVHPERNLQQLCIAIAKSTRCYADKIIVTDSRHRDIQYRPHTATTANSNSERTGRPRRDSERFDRPSLYQLGVASGHVYPTASGDNLSRPHFSRQRVTSELVHILSISGTDWIAVFFTPFHNPFHKNMENLSIWRSTGAPTPHKHPTHSTHTQAHPHFFSQAHLQTTTTSHPTRTRISTTIHVQRSTIASGRSFCTHIFTTRCMRARHALLVCSAPFSHTHTQTALEGSAP